MRQAGRYDGHEYVRCSSGGGGTYPDVHRQAAGSERALLIAFFCCVRTAVGTLAGALRVYHVTIYYSLYAIARLSMYCAYVPHVPVCGSPGRSPHRMWRIDRAHNMPETGESAGPGSGSIAQLSGRVESSVRVPGHSPSRLDCS